MRCAWCGEKIEDEPVWRKDKSYCSEECAEMDINEDEQEEKKEEEEEEEE